MRSMAPTIRRLIGSLCLFLFGAGYLPAEVFKQTALYDTIEQLEREHSEKLKSGLQAHNYVTTGFVPEPPKNDQLQSLTPEASRRHITSGPQDLPLIFTDFLIDRAVDELVTSFLRSALSEDTRTAELLMPATSVILSNLDDYEVVALLPALRSSSIDDMRNIIENILTYCARRTEDARRTEEEQDEIQGGADLFCDNRSLVKYLDTRLEDLRELHFVFELVKKGANPGVALSRLSGIEVRESCTAKALRTVGMISREWVYASLITEINATTETLRDIILEDSKNRVTFMTNLKKMLRVREIDVDELNRLFAGVIRRLDHVDRVMSDSDNTVAVVDVLGIAIEAVEFVARNVCSEGSGKPQVLLDLFLMGQRAAVENRYTDLVSVVLRSFDSLDQIDDCTECEKRADRWMPASVEQLVVLSASVAEADSGEEIWRVLESFAAPAGSFATKRRDGMHATIGAYPGLFA